MISPAFTLVFYKKTCTWLSAWFSRDGASPVSQALCQPIGNAVRSVVPAFGALAVHPWGKGKGTVM